MHTFKLIAWSNLVVAFRPAVETLKYVHLSRNLNIHLKRRVTCVLCVGAVYVFCLLVYFVGEKRRRCQKDKLTAVGKWCNRNTTAMCAWQQICPQSKPLRWLYLSHYVVIVILGFFFWFYRLPDCAISNMRQKTNIPAVDYNDQWFWRSHLDVKHFCKSVSLGCALYIPFCLTLSDIGR